MTHIGEGRLGPGAVTIDLRRAGVAVLVVAILVLGGLTVASFWPLFTGAETAVAIVGCVFGLLFGLLWLLTVVMLPKILKPSSLAFDQRGIHYSYGPAATLVGWEEIAAVGIGYEQPPDLPSLNTSLTGAAQDYAKGKVLDAVGLDKKRAYGLEIFPVHPEVLKRHPVLSRFGREQAPPAAWIRSGVPPHGAGAESLPLPTLPPVRWRIPLPPMIGVNPSVERGMMMFRPQAWLGWFARPWRGGIGVGGKRVVD